MIFLSEKFLMGNLFDFFIFSIIFISQNLYLKRLPNSLSLGYLFFITAGIKK